RRLVVVRGHGEDPVRAGLDRGLRAGDRTPRVVAAGPGQDRHLARGHLDRDRDDPPLLVVAERHALARRAAGHEDVDALGYLPRDQPPQGGFVEGAIVRERRDERHARTGKRSRHVRFSVSTPDRGGVLRSASPTVSSIVVPRAAGYITDRSPGGRSSPSPAAARRLPRSWPWPRACLRARAAAAPTRVPTARGTARARGGP